MDGLCKDDNNGFFYSAIHLNEKYWNMLLKTKVLSCLNLPVKLYLHSIIDTAKHLNRER